MHKTISFHLWLKLLVVDSKGERGHYKITKKVKDIDYTISLTNFLAKFLGKISN